MSHGPATGTSREISPATARDITVYRVAARRRGPNQLSVICVAPPLVAASLSFSRPAALPPSIPLSLSPSLHLSLQPPLPLRPHPPRAQTDPKHCHWTITDSAQMAPKLLCFLSRARAHVTDVVVRPPKKKEKKKIKRDAPLVMELTVRTTVPLPSPPPCRRACDNDEQSGFFFFSFCFVFPLIMSAARWWRRCCRSGDSFLACVAAFSANKSRL